MQDKNQLLFEMENAIGLFRQGDYGQGNAKMGQILGQMASLHSQHPNFFTSIQSSLEAMLHRQELEDYVGLADLLEFDLVPLLQKL